MRDDEANLNKDRLALALEAAGLDLWENDLVTGAVTRKATKTFAELGFTEEEIASAVPDIYGLFHPDDVDTVRQAVAEGALRTDVDPDLISRLVFGMVGSLVEWYRPGGAISPADLAETVAEVVFDGLRSGGRSG